MKIPTCSLNVRLQHIPLAKITQLSHALQGVAPYLEAGCYRLKQLEQLTDTAITYLLYATPLGVVKQPGKHQYTLVNNLRTFQLMRDWLDIDDVVERERRTDVLNKVPVLCFDTVDETALAAIACGESLILPMVHLLSGKQPVKLKMRWHAANSGVRHHLLGKLTCCRWLQLMFSRSASGRTLPVKKTISEPQQISESDKASFRSSNQEEEEGEDV